MKTRLTSDSPIGKRPAVTHVAWALLLCLTVLAFSERGIAQKPQNNIPADELAPPAFASAFRSSKGRTGSESSPVTRFVTDVKSGREGSDLVISIHSDGPLSHEEFVLSNPARLVLDLTNAENKVPFYNLPINDAKVKQLRVRQFQTTSPKITRMVFDLEEDHGRYQVLGDSEPLKVVFYEGRKADNSVARGSNLAATTVAKTQPSDSPDNQSGNGTNGNPQTGSRPAPVINDLATSEIPLSALGTGARVEAAPRQSIALPREVPSPAAAPPPPPAPAPPTTRTVLTIDGSQEESRFSGEPLTLDLVDIPLVDFFRLMAEEGGINIVMDPGIRGSLSIKVVKVPWDQIFDAALQNNGLDKQLEGNLVRIASRATLQEEAKQREALKKATLLAADVETRIKRLNYAKAASFISTLADQKTVRGTVVVDERSNSLVMTDIPEAIEKMTGLVEALDTPQPQVEIEARIISATRDFARDIGVQFGFVQGNLERVTVGGPNTFGTIGGTRPTATPVSTFAGGNPISGRGAATSQSSQSAGVSTGSGSGTPAGNLNLNLPAGRAFSGIGLSIGNIFDTFLLDAAITAGESKGLAKLISQPKVTAQNNQEATVTQGLRFPVQIVANQTVTVQFQNAALTLTVTPQITQEGNIVMDLKVENNTPDFSRQVNGIPSIRTSESTTRVLVGDGGTTVIGGILLDSESTTEDRIPGLASLPIIGNVFKRTSVSRNVQEVIFFITPRIVK